MGKGPPPVQGAGILIRPLHTNLPGPQFPQPAERFEGESLETAVPTGITSRQSCDTSRPTTGHHAHSRGLPRPLGASRLFLTGSGVAVGNAGERVSGAWTYAPERPRPQPRVGGEGQGTGRVPWLQARLAPSLRHQVAGAASGSPHSGAVSPAAPTSCQSLSLQRALPT